VKEVTFDWGESVVVIVFRKMLWRQHGESLTHIDHTNSYACGLDSALCARIVPNKFWCEPRTEEGLLNGKQIPLSRWCEILVDILRIYVRVKNNDFFDRRISPGQDKTYVCPLFLLR
jgi:hypothetical protein